MSLITVQGHCLEYDFIEGGLPDSPVLVFLHEGLGSIALWKDFPARCAEAAGLRALLYSRYGYGHSDPLKSPRRPNYMHDEALHTLPELLDKLEIDRAILIGHSDGASIALIHAGGSSRPPEAIIVMAPHTTVEEKAVRGIEAVMHTYETTDLRDKLARYHSDPDSAFRGWSDIWLDPQFRSWNIEEYLPRIMCPVLAIQGEDDQYATSEQIDSITRAVPSAQAIVLKRCRHSPHIDQPDTVIERIAQFIESLPN